MGRSPCCSKEGLNRGAWTALEDKILTAYIKAHGEGKWRSLPKRAGLKRCGKSCRLRWLNYLRPDIKRGNISRDEEELIIRLHKLLGNRWSLIAGRLPGRTDNEIKNYWNTNLGKKANGVECKSNNSNSITKNTKTKNPSSSDHQAQPTTQVIRTKATRCTKVLISLLSSPPPDPQPEFHSDDFNSTDIHRPAQPSSWAHHHDFQQFNSTKTDRLMELQSCHLDNFLNLDSDQFQPSDGDVNYDFQGNFSIDNHDHSCLPFEEGQPIFTDWTADAPSTDLADNANLDLDALAFLLDSEGW